MKLVNGEKLLKWLKSCEHAGSCEPEEYSGFMDVVERYTLSPAELAGILGGIAWVLEEIKDRLKEDPPSQPACGCHSVILKVIEVLESQAPVSEPSLANKDRRKAEAWDKLYGDVVKWDRTVDKEFAYVVNKKEMDELLAQEESDDH